MLRFRRIASAVGLALATVALLAPVAQAGPTLAGGANPRATGQAAPAGVRGDRETLARTDWRAVFAGATGSAIVIAMGAGAIGLLRRGKLIA